MIGSGFLGLVAALAITFGLLALAVRLLRKMQGGSFSGGDGVPFRILRRISVGPKQGVALLRVNDRVLVISVADGGARLLTELEGEGLRQALEPPVERAMPTVAKGWALPLLKRVGLAVILCLAPGIARAQVADSIPPAPAINIVVPPVQLPSVTAGAQIPAAPAAPTVDPTPVPAFEPGAAPAPRAKSQAPRVTPPAVPQVNISMGEGPNALHLSGTVGLVVFMGVLTLLPAMFLLMTSFTRILIVLHFLRSALGTQSAPPNQLLVAVAVLLTGVIMNPVLQETHRTAIQPYLDGRITQSEAYSKALLPFREFMLTNTREQDLNLMADLGHVAPVDSVEQLPTVVVISSFVISELRTSFQMGFVIFLPFVVVDLVVGSVLMSMGMFMLPPMMISLPFKLLLFVLADGWTLVVQNLVASFR
ncbi:MAG: flagellar type III secretion system pore protein FliP [Gemmatimonadota bacterium]